MKENINIFYIVFGTLIVIGLMCFIVMGVRLQIKYIDEDNKYNIRCSSLINLDCDRTLECYNDCEKTSSPAICRDKVLPYTFVNCRSGR